MPNHRYSSYIPIIFLCFDIISLSIAYFIAHYVKFGTIYLSQNYAVLYACLVSLWVLIFFSAKLQNANRESWVIDHLNKLNTALIANLALVFAIWFLVKPEYFSRHQLVLTYLFFGFLSAGWRILWYYAIRLYRAKGYNHRQVAVVGISKTSKELVNYFTRNPGFGYKFVGFFDNEENRQEVLGNVEDLEIYSEKNKIDFIYAYLPVLNNKQIKFLIDFAENNLIKLKIISDFSKLGLSNLSIQNHGSISVVNVTEIPLDHPLNKIIKRGFDILFSLIIILILLWWMLPLIGLLIKLESRGPILFKQSRTGLNNKKFTILKFRTMVVHNDSTVKQATKSDNRITRLGAFLRKTSLDEFPQFLNVFSGDMSVVGPRPHAIKHNEEFQRKIDRFVQRHAVKPGITGLAQAKGFRGETATFNDISGRVKLDRFYVKNWSLILDLRIIWLTSWSLIRGNDKAY
ncbi:MAG: undecaprenyl-phosphate glucose phosphotransferase [Reichenbachiella sp.]